MKSSVAERTIPERKVRERAQIRRWLETIMVEKNWAPTHLAQAAQVSTSTVTRFLNDERNTHSLSPETLRKISDGSGFDIPLSILEAKGGGRTVEGAPYAPTGDLNPGTVKLISISPFPRGVAPMITANRRVQRPAELVNDHTAFAVQMPDASLGVWVPERSILFCTKLRDPMRGDLAVVIDADGVGRVRPVKTSGPEGITLAERGGEDLVIAHDRIKDFGIVRVHVRP